MAAVWTFRLLTFFIVVVVGAISIANLVAESLRPALPAFPALASRAPLPEQVSSVGLASTIAPFRSDLKADYALGLAEQVLSSQSADQSEKATVAQDAIRDAFRIGPHDSRLWLALALIQSRNKPADSLVSEALKMSYLTGPNRLEIIPIRLQTVTANNALNDADLGELARGDVRAMLSQRPEQRLTLVNDYLHASEVGKKFLEESAKTIDPGFVDIMRGAK
jgi:hypothetical protein